MVTMYTRHDFNKPECPSMELEKIGIHSNGTIYYVCRNCRYAGKSNSFTKPFRVSEISQQLQ